MRMKYLKRHLPDFDTDEKRTHLQQFSKEDLIERLLVAYKNARIIAMTSDLLDNKALAYSEHCAGVHNAPKRRPTALQLP